MSEGPAVHCRVCGRADLRPLVSGRDRLCGAPGARDGRPVFAVAWCEECRCGTTQLTPNEANAAEAYPEEYYRDVLDIGGRIDRLDQLRIVEGAGIDLAGARVLEIGCCEGSLLRLLRQRGATVSGVEPGHVARAAARSTGLSVVTALSEVPDGAFDLVILFDVLEHVPEPPATLRWIEARLPRDGRVIVGVPNIDCIEFRLLKQRWFALELPRHLTHFSLRALDRLARRAGLARLAVEYAPASFFSKSFVDPRLKDGWLVASPPLARRVARASLAIVERALRSMGNRPYFSAVLGRR